MRQELSYNWEYVLFDDLVMFSLGGDWGKSIDTLSEGWIPVNVIRSTEFKNWAKEKGSSSVERIIKASSLEKRKLEENDLIIEISGGGPDQPVGRVLSIDKQVISSKNNPLICSNFCRQIRLIQLINSKYTFYNLSFQYQNGNFNEFQNHSINIRNLQFKEFCANTIIPLPPFNEQKRIVSKLDQIMPKIDGVKERLVHIPQLIKRFRQSVLTAAVTGKLTEKWRHEHPDIESAEKLLEEYKIFRIDKAKDKRKLKLIKKYYSENEIRLRSKQSPYDLPETWKFCEINNIGDVCNGSTPSRKVDKYWGNDFNWVSSGEVQNCVLKKTNEKISQLGFENSSVKLLPKGTVLIAMIGEGRTRGQSAILDIEATCNQNVAAVIINHNCVLTKYLFYWFIFQYDKNRRIGSGSGPKALNCQRVRELDFILPPLEEQCEIVRQVDKLFSFADKLEAHHKKAKEKLDKLSQSVLAKAFRGKLVPQDPSDEPAAKLLERIKEEKTRLEIELKKMRRNSSRAHK